MTRRFFSALAVALSLASGTLAAADSIYPVPIQHPAAIQVPHFFHMVTVISPYERVIQLADESRWTIAESDLVEALSWRQGDFVVLTKNRGWWSTDYSYCLTNQSNRSYVRVNPLSGPLHTSPYAHHITGMDHNSPGRKVVYLDHKSQWAISEDDHAIVQKWEVNDTIIMAYHDAWFTYYDTVLIDVETNTCVKARRI